MSDTQETVKEIEAIYEYLRNVSETYVKGLHSGPVLESLEETFRKELKEQGRTDIKLEDMSHVEKNFTEHAVTCMDGKLFDVSRVLSRRFTEDIAKMQYDCEAFVAVLNQAVHDLVEYGIPSLATRITVPMLNIKIKDYIVEAFLWMYVLTPKAEVEKTLEVSEQTQDKEETC